MNVDKSAETKAITTQGTLMDADTLTALQGSIAKWEAIVDGTGVDDGPSNCPLCKKFNRMVNRKAQSACGGCPVVDAVNDIACGSTPYDEWSYAEEEEDSERMAIAAQAELDFLKSLLPKKPT